MEETPAAPFARSLPGVFDLPRVNVFYPLLALTLVLGLFLRLRGYWGDFPLFDGGIPEIADLVREQFRRGKLVHHFFQVVVARWRGQRGEQRLAYFHCCLRSIAKSQERSLRTHVERRQLCRELEARLGGVHDLQLAESRRDESAVIRGLGGLQRESQD